MTKEDVIGQSKSGSVTKALTIQWKPLKEVLRNGTLATEMLRSCTMRHWGETDIARANGLAVIGRLKTQNVKIETLETPGGHEWANWRLYLKEVAPKLFR